MDELSVGLSRVWAEQWVRTTSHLQEATVHARGWLERRPGHAPVQAEVDPRPPLRGHHAATTDAGTPAGHFPLHEQDHLGPCSIVQQSAQDGCGQVERNVADHHIRSGRARPVKQVSVDDAYVFLLAELTGRCKSVRQPAIDLDSRQGPAELLRLSCEPALARADVDDRTGRVAYQPGEPVDRGVVSEEVLAVLMSAATVSGHRKGRSIEAGVRARKSAARLDSRSGRTSWNRFRRYPWPPPYRTRAVQQLIKGLAWGPPTSRAVWA